MNAYHFALLRYVHHAAAGEFVNIGVVMWVPERQQLLYQLSERYSRLSRFFSEFDGSGYKQLVRDLHSRLRTLAERAGAVDGLDTALAALVPVDSTCFASSPAMGGLVANPDERLSQLFYEFVGKYEGATPRERHDEVEIMARVDSFLRARNLAEQVDWNVEIQGSNYAHKFRIGWLNGMQQVLEPISFDYLSAEQVLEKANSWTGRLVNLGAGKAFRMTGVVSTPQRSDLLPAYEQAVAILEASPGVRKVVREDDLEEVASTIEADLATQPE